MFVLKGPNIKLTCPAAITIRGRDKPVSGGNQSKWPGQVQRPVRPSTLLLAQYQVHDPTAPDVRTGTATVVEDLVVVATRILKRVGKNWHGGELTRLVHLPGERQHGVCAPSGIEGDRAERIAEDVAKQLYLFLYLLVI